MHVQGRYSFVGAQPALEVVARGHSVTVIDHSTRQRTTTEEEDPMRVGNASAAYTYMRDCLPAGGNPHASHFGVVAQRPPQVVPA